MSWGLQKKDLTSSVESGIIRQGGDAMLLPDYDQAVIPLEKFTGYVLNPMVDPDKAVAFERALGYSAKDAEKLIGNIRSHLGVSPCREKGDIGYGMTYEVLMVLTGENGKAANVLTAWIKDGKNGELRLTSAYIKKRKEAK
jgi:hypothetical protein